MHKSMMIAVAGALAFAQPAFAQDAEPENEPENEIAEKLNDPRFQDEIATMFSGFLSAMMQVPIGQMAHAVEEAIPEDMRGDERIADIDPDATLGDLARRDNPDFEMEMDLRVRQGAAMAGIMASEFAALIPQFRAMGERMRERMEQRD